jgi:hypothetical protein
MQNCVSRLPPTQRTRRRNLHQTLGYDNHRERGHEYSASDALHQSELKTEAAGTSVVLHFSSHLTKA